MSFQQYLYSTPASVAGYFRYCAVAVILLFSQAGKAQDTTSVGGLMATARTAAIDAKNYDRAVLLGKKALLLAPGNTEILVFVGRTYSWAGNIDSSGHYLRMAIAADSLLEDAHIAYSDLLYWNKKNEEALAVCERGLRLLPNSQPLHLRKAKVLMAMGNYKTALHVTDTLLRADKHNTEVRALNTTLKDLYYKNRVTLKFDYATFDKQFPDPWLFYSIEYNRITKLGAIVARVNQVERFRQQGQQYEIDLYPKISKTFYLYLNAGYADQVAILPRWRSGVSLFANLPHAFEAEAGIRHLQFTNDVFFYTGYVGKYYKNFLFSSRVFVTPSTTGYARSAGIAIRYYTGGADDFISLNTMAGVSPDDRRYNLQINTDNKLQSYLGELTYRKSIRKINIISCNVSLFRQEYRPGIVGQQTQIGIGYTRRF
jgi:YaiO family outer membrane protein